MIDDIACVTVMALNRDPVPISAGNDLVSFVSLCYHDSGVGNSRSIRNADTYSMAGTSGHIPPLRRAASSLAVIGFHVSSLPSSGGRKSQEFM